MVWQVLTAGDAMSGQDAAILKAVFTQSPVRLYVLDHQLRVVRMSTIAGERHDTSVRHLLGRHFTEACEFSDPEEEAAVAQRVLESGEPVVNRLVRRDKTPDRPTRRIYSVSYLRLEDSTGDVVGLVTSALDVTERENAQNRLTLLDTVRTQVGHLLNVMHVCSELVDAVVPAFAGIADVEVIEDVVRGEEPPRYRSTGTLSCAEQPSEAGSRVPRSASSALCRSAPLLGHLDRPAADPYEDR
ncbi:PAS domain-containing protein [Streptomyces kaempferi]